MGIIFGTNLDDAKADVAELNRKVATLLCYNRNVHVPRKGELVEFHFSKSENGCSRDFYYTLEVIEVSYDYGLNDGYQSVKVELHMDTTDRKYRSIRDWSVWFRKFRYGKV